MPHIPPTRPALRSCGTCALAKVRRGDSADCRACADQETLNNPKPRWRAEE